MWTVTIYHVSSVVDAEMCEPSQVSSVLSEERFRTVRQMPVFRSFSPTVESHDDDVSLSFQRVDISLHGLQVEVSWSVAVLSE